MPFLGLGNPFKGIRNQLKSAKAFLFSSPEKVRTLLLFFSIQYPIAPITHPSPLFLPNSPEKDLHAALIAEDEEKALQVLHVCVCPSPSP